GRGGGVAVWRPLPGGAPGGVARVDAVGLGRPDVPGGDVPGPLQFAGLDQVEQDLVVGHQHAAGLVDDGRVAQLLVRVPGRQDRHGRLVDRGVTQPRVQVAGHVGGRGRAGDAAAVRLRADDRRIAAVIFRDHGPGEVEGRAGDVGVDVDAARKDHAARRVDGTAALDVGDDAAVADADVPDLAVDA